MATSLFSNEPFSWKTNYAHPNAWDASYAPLSLSDMFVASVAANPQKPLVEFLGRSYNYQQIHTEARAFAAGLQDIGIQKGDRVGLFLPNVPIYLAAYYGASMAGATLVNFSPLYTPDELKAQLADSGARLLVTLDSPLLLPKALEVLNDSALEKLIVGRLAEMLPWYKGLALSLFGRSQISALPNSADVIPWRKMLAKTAPKPIDIDPLIDIALLQYTGGTTGTPKGAMLSHQNLTANARQVEALDPEAHNRDVIIGALPMFHVFANTCVLNRTVLNGGCIAMLPRFDAGQVLKLIGKVKATAMPGVPTMYQALLDHPDFTRTNFTSLRVCISGGAPLPAPVKAKFEQVSGAKLVEGYGLTESSGVVSSNPYSGNGRNGSIGQPAPATRIRLLDKDNPARDVPVGEAGELAFHGPQMMQGYWNRPEAEATAFALRDGVGGSERWLRSGDVAVIDDDGYIRIVDRLKDMIAVGGFKVYPSEVEKALLLHPAVKEALVIGVPDSYHGEVPRAFVTLNPEAEAISGEALCAWLNPRIGKHERVDRVVIRDTLPKTMIGKLDRKALRAEVL